ncbi:MAG: PqiC family protein [Rhodocyclaceae bacterium]
MMLRRALLALPCFIMLAACAGSPPARYYTLATPGTPAPAESAVPRTVFSLAVGPVTVPESVDRPQMVVRIGPNELKVSDEHRWAQPLRGEILRAISLNLARLMPQAQVSAYTENAASIADYRLSLDIQRIEATLGGAVAIEAQWSLRSREGTEVHTGHSAANAETTANTYEALASAYGRAIKSVSRDIAVSTELLPDARRR